MNQKILVSGARGQVGSHVFAMLKKRGVNVVAGISRPERAIEGVDCVVLNYAEPEAMVKVLEDVDTLFLIAPFVPQMKEWSLNAGNAAKAAGVAYLVRSSAIGADADSPVALAKVQGEIDYVIMESGMAYAIIRPMTFMQNFTTYHAQSIKEQGAIYQPQGEGKTSFVHVKDVAAVAVEALLDQERYQGKTYDVTGGESLSNAEVAALISQVIGKTVRYVDVPEDAAIQSMQEMGMPQVMIEQLMSLNRITKAGYATTITSTVKDMTGNDPITFKEFVEENATVWQ